MQASLMLPLLLLDVNVSKFVLLFIPFYTTNVYIYMYILGWVTQQWTESVVEERICIPNLVLGHEELV